jgi:hypothetical protein
MHHPCFVLTPFGLVMHGDVWIATSWATTTMKDSNTPAEMEFRQTEANLGLFVASDTLWQMRLTNLNSLI